MTMGEFVASKAVVIVRHSSEFFSKCYDEGQIINADGKKLVLETDGDKSIPDQLMLAFKVAEEDKNESLSLPTAILDFISCQIYAMKHTKEQFESAGMDDIRKYSKKLMTHTNRNLVLMLLVLIFSNVGDYIVAAQDSVTN